MEKLFTRRATVVFIGLLTLWRAYLAATLQLHPDEGYYWLWSRFLQPGYFDHPPMVAYFIRLTTLAAGGEFWVRLSGIVVSLLLSVLMWRLAMQLFRREETAALSVILLNVFPVTMTGAIIVTPDAPAFLFWGLGVFLAWQLFSSGRAVYWYLLGAVFGLALLSKYTAVLFAPCLFLFLVFTKERRWLATAHPYAALLVAGLVFLPVVYWNSVNDWISFRFQLSHGLGGSSYKLANLFEFLGSQMLVASPFAWLAGAWFGVRWLLRGDREKLFLVMTSLPIIAFFAYASLKKPGEANWPALAYFSFALILGAGLSGGGKARRALALFIIVTSLGMSMLVTLHARFGVLPLARYSADLAKADATNWFYGWRELAIEIERRPGVRFVMTPSHTLSAQVSYYLRERVPVIVNRGIARPSQYNLWNGLYDGLEGENGLYVYVEGDDPGPLGEYFASVDETPALEIRRAGFPIRRYRIVSGTGYRKGASLTH